MAGDGMNRIKHVVVVMMENRSFDNVLGYLRHPDHGNGNHCATHHVIIAS